MVWTILGCTRHVLSTIFNTIGGFLPLLLFVDGDFWPSLAIVLAGSIAGASLIALLFTPGDYLIITRAKKLATDDDVPTTAPNDIPDLPRAALA